MLDLAILEQETPPDDLPDDGGRYFGSDEKKVDCQVDEV